MKKLSSIIVILIITLFVMIFSSGCHRSEKNVPAENPATLKEPLIKANQELVRTESEQIDDFIRRHNWKMSSTPSGLRYMIYEQGRGRPAKADSPVKLLYTMSLLTGDTVYTSRQDGPLSFIPGKGQVISGLEEGILLLREGDRAKFIIPSHLAYGLIGDQKKIQQKASLVYDVELVRAGN